LAVCGVAVAGFAGSQAWGLWFLDDKGKDSGKDARTVTIDQLPAPAKDAVLKEAGKSALKEIHEFERPDHKVFRVTWMSEGKLIQFWLNEDGKMLHKNKVIGLDQAPAIVKENALHHTGDYKLKEVEEVTRAGGDRFYEVDYLVAGKQAQIRLSQDGNLLFKGVVKNVNDIPASVKDTLATHAGKDVKVRTAVDATCNGRTYYLAWWMEDGKRHEVRVSPEGRLVQVERQVAMDALPTSARDSILKEAGKMKIERVNEITRGDTRGYQALWYAEGKPVFYEVGSDGKRVDREDESTCIFGEYHGWMG
jgi:hypothetical protein